MLEVALIAGSFVLAALATVLLFRVRRRTRESAAPIDSTLRERLDSKLAETHTTERTHLESPPRIHQVVVVDRTDDTEPTIVPIVRIDLGTTEPPSMDLAFEYVASVLEAIHPVFDDAGVIERVRHYDVQFTFGPDGLLVSRLCQRVSVPLECADRVCRDPQYRAPNVKRDVEAGDDGSDDDAPVVWGACRTYRERGPVPTRTDE